MDAARERWRDSSGWQGVQCMLELGGATLCIDGLIGRRLRSRDQNA